jgi:hypothetical protein
MYVVCMCVVPHSDKQHTVKRHYIKHVNIDFVANVFADLCLLVFICVDK